MKMMKGFTLIELMIAMVLGLFVAGATITIYMLTVSGSSDTVKSARLNHDLSLAMTLMVNDIRRAGYWGGAIAGANSAANPFMVNTERMHVLAGGNCILYSYDASRDNPAGSNSPSDADADGDDVESNEYYGFKLDNGTIRMRLTGNNTTSADCSDGSWATSEIIDGDLINVTTLNFNPRYSCRNVSDSSLTTYPDPDPLVASNECTTAGDSVIELRQVIITLTGQLVDDTAVTKTLTETVMIRNNRIL